MHVSQTSFCEICKVINHDHASKDHRINAMAYIASERMQWLLVFIKKLHEKPQTPSQITQKTRTQ